jgi:hypothetical protein
MVPWRNLLLAAARSRPVDDSFSHPICERGRRRIRWRSDSTPQSSPDFERPQGLWALTWPCAESKHASQISTITSTNKESRTATEGDGLSTARDTAEGLARSRHTSKRDCATDLPVPSASGDLTDSGVVRSQKVPAVGSPNARVASLDVVPCGLTPQLQTCMDFAGKESKATVGPKRK